jgi:hypothetical protein
MLSPPLHCTLVLQSFFMVLVPSKIFVPSEYMKLRLPCQLVDDLEAELVAVEEG